MMRSICFPVDPRWIKNPDNNPLATMSARMGAAARTRLCIETIWLVLSAHFSKPGRHFTGSDLMTRPNRWTVRLTRISMGTVDPITGGASMKAIQDAVARWCEVPNERDPIWTWVEPIKQEKRGYVKGADGSRRAWTGVRIELEDLAPGESKPIELATIEGYIARAKANLKARESLKPKKTKKDKTMARGTQVYHADKGERAASSAARSKAEAAFAKVTGRDKFDKRVRSPAEQDADAVAAELRSCGVKVERKGNVLAPVRVPAGSEDATPRMLVDCPACGAKRGIVCTTAGKLVGGVHVERARLAGLKVAADRVVPVKPTGARKMAREVPKDLEAMRAQARSATCSTCDRGGGFECWDLSDHDRQTSPSFEYGVHVARARAAGLPPFPCVADLDAGAKPVLVDVPASLGVHEGLAVKPAWIWHPGRGAEVWLALPWGVCGACGGRGRFTGFEDAFRLLDDPAHRPSITTNCADCHGTGRAPLYVRRSAGEQKSPLECITFNVPAEHVPVFGRTVTLVRGVHITRAGRLCWMFRAKEGRGV